MEPSSQNQATIHPGFEFNLQRLALLRIGRTIWQKPKVIAEMENWFEFYYFWPYTPTKMWHTLLRKILTNVEKQISLPEHLQRELADIIKEMGIQLLDYLMHVRRMNNDYYRRLCPSYWESINFPSSIHWTSQATIDVRKTVEESWVKNPGSKQLCATYHMAVRSGIDEEKAHEIWNLMSDKQQWMYCGLFKEEYAVNSYYEHHREGTLDRLKDELTNSHGSYRSKVIYDNQLTFDENMLLTFVAEGYSEAAKLMWYRLDNLSRERVIEDAAEIAFFRWRHPIRNYDDFMTRQWAELSIFLINHLPSQQKIELISRTTSDMLRMLALTWPWKLFFFQVFDEYYGNFEEDENFGSLLYEIAELLIKEDAKTGYIIEGSKNQQLLQKCWKRLPSAVKLRLRGTLIRTIDSLIKARDMNTVKLILNTEGISRIKQQVLQYSTNVFEEMVERYEMAVLDQFIEDNLKNEREKREFKQSLLPHMKFIVRGKFDRADKFLDWQCKNDREKRAVKMSIDYRGIMRDQFWYAREKMVSQFLNWQCASLKTKRNKNDLNCKFSQEIIYKLWMRWKLHVDDGKNRAVEFFKWFLNIERKITSFPFWKKVDDDFIALLVEAILNHNYFDIVDNLKFWCSMTDQQVKDIKRRILKSSKTEICRHYIEISEIHVTRNFLKWIDDESETKKFINEFIAKKGSTSCYLFITNDRSKPSSKKESKFQDFIDIWIKPLENAQLKQFKAGVSFQARKMKYKQPEDLANYEIFQTILKEMT